MATLIYLIRHAETEWSLSGRHTGRTDLPLTANGESRALLLRPRLNGVTFAHVHTSPLKRAFRTCELSGLALGTFILPVPISNPGFPEGPDRVSGCTACARSACP